VSEKSTQSENGERGRTMDGPDPEHLDHAIRCEGCFLREEIRQILSSTRAPAEKLRAVQLALSPPQSLPEAVLNDRGWPVLVTSTGRDDLDCRR